MPFSRYTTRDKFGRTITFYLSRAEASPHPLPLTVFIGGSGCISNFTKKGDRIAGGIQNLLLQQVQGRARVMVVEKPGVNYLDFPADPGGATACSPTFLEEHTLPRWAEAVGAAIRAAHTLPDIARDKTLVVGHSEGGLVAARVAAENSVITHVASLSGGGPTQLFDLVEIARSQGQDDHNQTPAQRVDSVYTTWSLIAADPMSTTKSFLGHPYRRWSTFLQDSVLAELQKTKARIYIAQGTEDTSVTVASFDILRAQLVAQGRDVTADRVEGGDHGYHLKTDATPIDGLQAVMGKVATWFLNDTKP
jgi:dienelactone hydrolase